MTASDALRLLRATVGTDALDQCPARSLPATDQMLCHDAAGFEIACAGTGHDGDIRAGVARSFTASASGTVTDETTGLMWEAKCDGLPCPWIHDKDTEYDWDAAFSVHITALNAGAFAGYGDWRVPNLFELATLIDSSKQYDVWLPPDEFRDTWRWEPRPSTFDAFDSCESDCGVGQCSCTAPRMYWTSTSSGESRLHFNAWVIEALGGIIDVTGKPGRAGVRAVRTVSSADAPAERICSRDVAAPSATDALRWLQTSVGIESVTRCATGQMPSTGQTECWNSRYGDSISCQNSGHDGEVQAGPAREFTNNGNGTIAEHVTGLTWEVKCDGPSCSPHHDKDMVYTWEAALAHAETLNAMSFAGYSDWRIPNEMELLVLWTPDRRDINDKATFAVLDECAADCGVTECSCTAGGTYWSSTSTYARSDCDSGDEAPCAAKVLDLPTGLIGGGLSIWRKDWEAHVRAVRGGM